MWKRIAVCLLFLAQACSPAAPPAAPSDARPLDIPVDLRTEVQRASDIGVELYLQDRASWVATDVLAARVRDIPSAGVRGWVTMREAGTDLKPNGRWFIAFYDDQEPPRILYRVHLPQSLKPETNALERVSPLEVAQGAMRTMIRARQTAIRAVPPASMRINTVMMPAEAIGRQGWLVYLLAATAKPRMVVFGKHHRAVVSPDGATVTEMVPLSKADLVLPLDDPNAPPGSRSVGLMVTHLVTDAPIETHVFASLSHGKMLIYVGTRRGVFRVEGPDITYLGEPK